MLFESLREKLESYQELNSMLYSLLFTGKAIVYNYYETSINIATMFGFVKNENGVLAVSNRIFETWLYNLYLSSAEMQKKEICGIVDWQESVYHKWVFEYAIGSWKICYSIFRIYMVTVMRHFLKMKVEIFSFVFKTDHQWNRQLLYRDSNQRAETDRYYCRLFGWTVYYRNEDLAWKGI